MLKITSTLLIHDDEIKITFIRGSGPGGQNVNKVASAAHLRFNVLSSASLPETIRQRLMTMLGAKLTQEGELVIKAHRYRTQERNKNDALERLKTLLRQAAIPPKKRKKTFLPFASKQKRLTNKKRQSATKLLRRIKPEN